MKGKKEQPGFEFHPVANMFPLMNDAELEELTRDIKENGLRNPILTFDDKIIDGRNRQAACQKAGVTIRREKWEPKGRSLVKFVTSLNLHRRHLTTEQRALCAVEFAKHFEEEAKERKFAGLKQNQGTVSENLRNEEKGRSSNKAGEAFGVSGRSVDHAKKIMKSGISELVEAVRSGKFKLYIASKIAKLPPGEQKKYLEQEKMVERISEAQNVDPAKVHLQARAAEQLIPWVKAFSELEEKILVAILKSVIRGEKV